jgi:hypothetical protein
MRAVVRRMFLPAMISQLLRGGGERKHQVITDEKLGETGAKLEHSQKSLMHLASYF